MAEIPAVGEDSDSDVDAFDIGKEGDLFADMKVEPATPIVGTPARVNAPQAKSTPPDAKEWQSFFARFVVRGITAGYVAMVLRDIEDDLTPREREKIYLSDEDLMELAAPMAAFSSKNAFLKKHGRTIVSAADSSESVIALFLWMRRVNKIAKAHRRPAAGQPIVGTVMEGGTDNGQFSQQDDGGSDPFRYVPGSFGPGSGG